MKTSYKINGKIKVMWARKKAILDIRSWLVESALNNPSIDLLTNQFMKFQEKKSKKN